MSAKDRQDTDFGYERVPWGDKQSRVRGVFDASVYVAEAWFPMEVPAAVCAVAPLGINSTATVSTRVNKKVHLVMNCGPLPFRLVLIIAFSSICKTFLSFGGEPASNRFYRTSF